MSYRPEPTPAPKVVVVREKIVREPKEPREPRERPIKISIEPLVVPIIIGGTLIFYSLYKEQIHQTVDKLLNFIPGIGDFLKDLPAYPLPAITDIIDVPIGGSGIPSGSTLWTSKSWCNGKSRSISGHHQKDPSDSRLDIAAGNGRRGTFTGNCEAKLQGDQARFYIYANNYNSGMWMRAKSGGIDNLSLKLRSRHGEGGSGPNRFGGYGMSFHPSSGEVESKREDYHNVHTTLGSCKGPRWNDGKYHDIGFTCQDSGGAVVLKGYVDNRLVCTVTDKSPKGYMRDKGLYGRKSYVWIRTNGGGSVMLRDVSVKEIGALSGSKLALINANPEQRSPYILEPRITVPY